MAKSVIVLADTPAIVAHALSLLVPRIQAALQERPFFSLVVAGGSTPKPLYEALAQESLDWGRIHLFWGDERYVPVTDPQSNEGMVRKAWLDRVAIPAPNIHTMPTHLADPQEAALHYETELQTFFQTSSPQFPVFDVVLLGMGDDGHTASLFPGTAALEVTDRWVTVGTKDGQPRLTLTAPCINHARQIMFLVSGANKTPALKSIFAPTGDSARYPARLITGNALWLIDRAAQGDIML